MKNKKIVVCLVIAVMVLGFVLTALVGCKNYKDVAIQDMMDFLVQAIENTADGSRLNNMEIATSIAVDTKYGSSEKKYTIDLAAQLALSEDSTNQNAASLIIKDGDGKNIISAYYDESTKASDGSLIGDCVYLQLGEKKFILPAVFIREILKKNNAYLGNTASDNISKSIVNGVDGLTSTLSLMADMGVIKSQVSKDGLNYRLEISLEEIFGGDTWGEILDTITGDDSGIQEMISEFGIDLDITKLGEILPNLVLDLDIKVTSKKAEEAKIAGVAASLECPKKTIEIKKTNNGGNLLTIKLDEDFSATVSADFFFNEGKVQKLTNYTGYEWLGGAINLSASGTLTIENAVEGNITAGPLTLNLDIPAGTYKLLFEIEADPAALAEKDFTGIHCTAHAIDVALDALNAAVKYLNIQITTANNEDFLQIKLYQSNSGLMLSANVTAVINDTTVNGMLSEGISINNILTNLLPSLQIEIPNNFDTGYTYANGNNWDDGYKVDTDKGFVDKNNDNVPDRDADGNFVCADGYVLYRGIPVEITKAGYVWDENEGEDGAYVVNTEAGFVDKNEDGKPDVDEKTGIFVADTENGFVIYNGYPVLKSTLTEEQLKELEPKEEDNTFSVADLIKNLAVSIADGNISATLQNLAVNKDLSLEATLGVNASSVSVNAKLSGLNKLLAALPASLGIKVEIKYSDFHYGIVNNN